MRHFTILTLLCLAGVVQAAEKEAVRSLFGKAIERGVPLYNNGNPEACAAVYEVAVQAALDLGTDALLESERETLRAALASRDAWDLRRAMDRVLARGSFKPIMEAPLPAGFPETGPLDRVILKRYPRYRAARADGGFNQFWTLFNHIKRNDIAMTAPVEMGMREVRDGSALAMRDMAFLYGNPAMGEAGKDGEVEVVDSKPALVLSLGLRGPLTQGKISAARSKVELELKLRSGELERAGGWRLMGYNSPRIPAANRFHEIQLQVREKANG